jgi:hypothetical protein
MPLAVGVPVLAALALRGTTVRNIRGAVVALAGAALGVGHVLAYGQNLRRYTVGLGGTVWFWTQQEWSPPASSLLLVIAFVVATACWVVCLLSPSRQPRRAEQHETDSTALEPVEAGRPVTTAT